MVDICVTLSGIIFLFVHEFSEIQAGAIFKSQIATHKTDCLATAFCVQTNRSYKLNGCNEVLQFLKITVNHLTLADCKARN